MKDYKRKDKLFITIIALACLIMTIANPESYDIRDLAWNYSLMLLLFSAIFWFLAEVGDSFTGYIFRLSFDDTGGTRRRFTRADMNDLSRDELLMLAGDIVDDKGKIDVMSDEELARLIMLNNNSINTGKKTTFMEFVFKLYKTIKFVIISVLIVAIKLRKFVLDSIKSIRKSKRSRRKKKVWTLADLVKERSKLMAELGAKDER